MAKDILKEIIIILLLCLAILLILCIIFYRYNPIGKVVPNTIAYTVPESVKTDLEDDNIVEEEITVENIIYTVEGADLNIYKKSNSYIPGKANPFSTTTASSLNETNEEGLSESGSAISQPKSTDEKSTTQTETKQSTNTFWGSSGNK